MPPFSTPDRLGVGLVCLALTGTACANEPGAEAPTARQESPLVALTPTEYNNSVRDLLGMPSDGNAWPAEHPVTAKLGALPTDAKGAFSASKLNPWPWRFPAEAGIEEFEGMADGQIPSAYLVEELQRAAMYYGSYALLSPIFFGCDDYEALSKEEQESCGQTSLERFAQRAWRRPLSATEKDQVRQLWKTNFDAGPADEAVVLGVAAILQSPFFLYRIEEGASNPDNPNLRPLKPFELASKLSYLLWDSMPDAALFEAASEGGLQTPEQIHSQTLRMLDDPRARQAIVHFHHQWIGTQHIHQISPARRAFGPVYGITAVPELDTTGDGDWPAILLPIRHSMVGEAQLFIERTVFDGAGTLHALLSDNHGFLSSHTRPLYGENAKELPLPPVMYGYQYVTNSIGNDGAIQLVAAEFPESERAGLLTLPAVLALGAHPVHPSPILRGKRILERVACEDLGTPPAGAEASAPPDVVDAESTNRERTEAVTAPAPCAVCHNQLNPPGFAFESYDAMGAYRSQDNGKAVNTEGQLTLSGGENYIFKTGVELARQLSTSQQVRDCYVKRWLSYATGATVSDDDPSLLALQSTFATQDKVRELILNITTSELFRYRSQGGTP